MEPDMACSIIKRTADGGCTTGIIHADNDAISNFKKKRMIRHTLKRIFQSAFMGCLNFIKT